MEIMVKVFSENGKNRKYGFLFKVHKSHGKSGHQIEPEFYKKYSVDGEVPNGIHHEVEILSPDLSDHEFFKKLHIHISKSGKSFLCFTKSLGKKEVHDVIRAWCAGTVHAMETGESLGSLFEKHKVKDADFSIIKNIIRDEYKIYETSYEVR